MLGNRLDSIAEINRFKYPHAGGLRRMPRAEHMWQTGHMRHPLRRAPTGRLEPAFARRRDAARARPAPAAGLASGAAPVVVRDLVAGSPIGRAMLEGERGGVGV